MDIPEVSVAAVKLPIRAECAVPIIRLAEGSQSLAYGQVFVHHTYTQQFTLLNDSKLPAKFEVLPQVRGFVRARAGWQLGPEHVCFLGVLRPCRVHALQHEASQGLCTITAMPAASSIPAKGSCTVSLQLEAARVGRIQLPVDLRVAGSRNKPLQLVVDATAQGPWLDLAVMPAPAMADAAVAAAATPACGDVPEPAASDQGAAAGAAAGDGSAAAAAAEGQDARSSAAASEDGAAGTPSALAVPADSLSSASAGALAAEASSASALTAVTTASASKRRGGPRKGKRGPAAPQWASSAAVRFDKVQVLVPHWQELRLRNPTLVDAHVKLFVEGRDSVFEVGSALPWVAVSDTCHAPAAQACSARRCCVIRWSLMSSLCRLAERLRCWCACCWTTPPASRTRCTCWWQRALTCSCPSRRRASATRWCRRSWRSHSWRLGRNLRAGPGSERWRLSTWAASP
jgi:hypothetical protein